MRPRIKVSTRENSNLREGRILAQKSNGPALGFLFSNSKSGYDLEQVTSTL